MVGFSMTQHYSRSVGSPRMKSLQVAVLSLTLCGLCSAQTLTQNSAPNSSAASKATDAEFEHSRQLSQQGKYDEAIAELQQLSAAEPGLKGISHELGTAYY